MESSKSRVRNSRTSQTPASSSKGNQSGAQRLSGGRSVRNTRSIASGQSKTRMGYSRYSGGRSKVQHSSGYRGDGRKPPVYLLVDGERRNVTPKSLLVVSGNQEAGGSEAAENENPNAAEAVKEVDDVEAEAGDVVPDMESVGKSKDAGTSTNDRSGMGGARASLLDMSLAKTSSRAHNQTTSNADLGPLEVTLSETPTETLLHIPSMWQASDSPNIGTLVEDNRQYEERLQLRAGSDNYTERHTQTLMLSRKEKAVSFEPTPSREVATMATTWEIHDTSDSSGAAARMVSNTAWKTSSILLGRKASGHGGGNSEEPPSKVDVEVSRTVATTLATGCLLDVSEAASTKPGAKSKKQTPSASRDKSKVEQPQTADAGTETDKPEALDADALIFQRMSEEVLHSDGLSSRLLLIERSLVQGKYHERHLKYRNLPLANATDASEAGAEQEELDANAEGEAVKSVSSSNVFDDIESIASPKPISPRRNSKVTVDDANVDGSNTGRSFGDASEDENGADAKDADGNSMLDLLWKHECALTEGYTVTCMSYSKGNPDILAVGYGQWYFDNQNGGLVLFWSLRNPEFPERIIEPGVGVTAIDFSTRNPSYVAVGLYNGAIQVYDTRNKAARPETACGKGCGLSLGLPVLESQAVEGQQHMEPVWQLKWVDRGERGEVLISISTDGRVWEWSLKKGLTLSPLMELKRHGDTEGVISRTASGLCLDFPRDDSSIYFAGTEDGHIHKCSCSYNEAYLESYKGHEGPVYRVACNPFDPSIFLSCSADWTVKLWQDKKSSPVMNFHSVDLSEVVNDVAWSPFLPYFFALSTGDGRIELWDFESSAHDAISTLRVPEVPDPRLCKKKEEQSTKDGTTGEEPPETRQTMRTSSSYESSNDGARRGRQAEVEEWTPLVRPGLTRVAFSSNAPILAVGDAHGGVSIYRLSGEIGQLHASRRTAEELTVGELEEMQKRIQSAIVQVQEEEIQ